MSPAGPFLLSDACKPPATPLAQTPVPVFPMSWGPVKRGPGPAQRSPEGHSPARRSGPSPAPRGPAPAPQRRRSRNPPCWSCGWMGPEGARPRDPRCPLGGQGVGGSVSTAVAACPQEGCSLCSSKSPTTVRVRGPGHTPACLEEAPPSPWWLALSSGRTGASAQAHSPETLLPPSAPLSADSTFVHAPMSDPAPQPNTRALSEPTPFLSWSHPEGPVVVAPALRSSGARLALPWPREPRPSASPPSPPLCLSPEPSLPAPLYPQGSDLVPQMAPHGPATLGRNCQDLTGGMSPKGLCQVAAGLACGHEPGDMSHLLELRSSSLPGALSHRCL